MLRFHILLVCLLFLSSEINGKIQGLKLRQGEPCDTVGFFRDAVDCRKFYRCAEHETEIPGMPFLAKFEFECPVGTAFDDVLITCNYPHSLMNLPTNCPAETPTPAPSTDGSTVVQPPPNPEAQPTGSETSGAVGVVEVPNRIIRLPSSLGNPFHTIFFVPQGYFPSTNLLYYKK